MIEQFNIPAEQSIIGALMRDNDALDRIPDLNASHFYRGDHRAIFSEIAEQVQRGLKVDAVTLAEKLADKVEDCMRYLVKLHSTSPSAAGIEHHARIVRERAIKRSLAALGLEIHERAGTIEESSVCADYVAAKLDEITSCAASKEPRRMDSTLSEYLTLLQNRMDGKIKPIPVGFSHVDEMLDGGLERGTLTVIAGRPGTGKTAAGLGICRNVAEDGLSALFLSMEMSINQVNDRNISAIARIPMPWLRRPSENITDDQKWTAISHAVAKAREMRLYLDDQTGLTIGEIRAKARKVKRLEGLDIICIDQLSFITGAKSDKLHEAMGEYTRGLISIAKELDVAIVLLAQLNRECEKRADHRPIMSDLGVSGYIEQDAANIIFLYRDVLWNPNNTPDPDICEWISAKQRQGQPGIVGLRYIGHETRFEVPEYRWVRRIPQKEEKSRSRGFE